MAPPTCEAALTTALRQQQTLARACRVVGFGYWSGRDVEVEFRPAPPHSGVVFVRSDYDPPRRISAQVRHRVEMPRRTTLADQGARVEMVEHVLAALYGLEIDNCEVWLNSPELPGLDGSCQRLVELFREAGIVPQPALRRRLRITEVTRVGDEESWVEARPAKHAGLSIRYRLDYGPNSPIGRETIELKLTPQTFCTELAPARTFLLAEEAQWLRQQGLGTRVTPQDLLVFGPEGPLDNELRMENECVRHKALDLIGDLALAGCELVGTIIAHRSGHRLNAELVRMLLVEGQIDEELRKTG